VFPGVGELNSAECRSRLITKSMAGRLKCGLIGSLNAKKMRLVGVKLLTWRRGSWLNSGSIDYQSRQRGSGVPPGISITLFGVEGKEFLLTVAVQSVMNIFTASGLRVQSCVRTLLTQKI